MSSMYNESNHNQADPGAPTRSVEAEWISIPELARRIGMSREGVYRRARANDIPGLVPMGRRWVVNYTHFVEQSLRHDASSPAPFRREG